MKRLWGKKPADEDLAHQGVAVAAAAGAPREQWIREAIQHLAAVYEADRIGIWLEPERLPHPSAHTRFRGLVWDRGNDETPSEWSQLSTEAPLPSVVLAAAASAEVDLEAAPERAVLGPLLELRRALWVPIHTQAHLRGLILAGAKQRTTPLHRQPVEHTAAELSLALEREEQIRKAQSYSSDFAVTRELLQSLGSGASPDSLLHRLADSCVGLDGAPEAPAAVFVAIGVAERAFAGASAESHLSRKLSFLWSAGDNHMLPALQSGPLHGTWRTALETHRMVGSELQGIVTQGFAARAVAIPLTATGEVLGVLVAVLPATAASLATLERIELRASLAAAVLSQRRSDQERDRRSQARRSALKMSAQSAVLLDARGNVLEMSPSAQGLFPRSLPISAGPVLEWTGQPFTSFFSPADRERLASWLQQVVEAAAEERLAAPPPLEAGLLNGTRIRLHSLGPSQSSVLLLLEDALRS